MFNPGETVAHQFIIPFVATELAKVVISYKQDGDIMFEKTITSGFEEYQTKANTKFTITFSQEESLTFNPLKDVFAQINVLTVKGARASSKPIKIYTGPQYHKEVISSEAVTSEVIPDGT